MKVTTVIQKEDGDYTFSANLTDAQHAFLIEYALRDLLQRGLIPQLDGGEDDDVPLIAINPDPSGSIN